MFSMLSGSGGSMLAASSLQAPLGLPFRIKYLCLRSDPYFLSMEVSPVFSGYGQLLLSDPNPKHKKVKG